MRATIATILAAVALLLVAPVTAGAATPGSGVLPPATVDSASGCNGSVCIFLTGAGLYVSEWTTRAYPTSYVCSSPRFWRNGVLVATGSTACGGSGSEFVAHYGSGWFSDGDVLCNTWTNLPGKPCETVHS